MLGYAQEHGIPAVVIGKGSNLLFDDAGLRGVVVKIGHKLSRLAIGGTTVHAQSGISASRLARAVGLAGLCGLEHIIGIPGTLGGLVIMNGGSMRKAVGDTITEVKVMDRRGNTHIFPRDDCEFAYRRSRFQDEPYVIRDVTVELTSGSRDLIMTEMLGLLRDRRRKFPLTMPNCGSVFKSDPRIYGTFGPPGKIIESLGLKGLCIGGAMVDMRHANFIINVGSARSLDVLRLVARIGRLMQERLGTTVPCEGRYVGVTGRITSLEDVSLHAIS